MTFNEQNTPIDEIEALRKATWFDSKQAYQERYERHIRNLDQQLALLNQFNTQSEDTNMNDLTLITGNPIIGTSLPTIDFADPVEPLTRFQMLRTVAAIAKDDGCRLAEFRGQSLREVLDSLPTNYIVFWGCYSKADLDLTV